jgi:hypothetical protein
MIAGPPVSNAKVRGPASGRRSNAASFGFSVNVQRTPAPRSASKS